MNARILVLDDEKMIRWSLGQALGQAGYQVDMAASSREALELMANESPDIALLDFKLPDGTGIEVLKTLKRLSPHTPVIMITAHASIEGAIEATKEGAYDYLSKPFEVDELLQKVKRALETSQLRAEISRQHEESRKNYGIKNIIAHSASMKEVIRLIQRVAQSEASTILLLGESGVGKGLIARALHFEGSNWEKPFMNVTCTALAESLLESELFGHEKGAFTDAKNQKKGLFELGHGGTVFLDEIGDMPLSLQGKLLRVLEDKTFRRVGGTRDIKVAARIIAATNKNLEKDAQEGKFRKDLYFRLKVIPIVIPPLRERVEDILPLAQSFMRFFNTEFKKNVQGIEENTAHWMQQYRWPGNVRELRNAIERAVLLCDQELIERHDLPLETTSVESVATSTMVNNKLLTLPAGGLNLEELEKDLVKQALEKARGNRTRAAKLLGMNRDQIRYRIEKFGFAENTEIQSIDS